MIKLESKIEHWDHYYCKVIGYPPYVTLLRGSKEHTQFLKDTTEKSRKFIKSYTNNI